MKVRDFEALGERVFTDIEITPQMMGISSSGIRARASRGRNFLRLIPPAIRKFNKAVIEGNIRWDELYSILPIMDDIPNIDNLIAASLKTGQRRLVIALPVNIDEHSHWWLRPEMPKSTLTYFERYQLIMSLFAVLNFPPPLIVPLFCRSGEPVLLEAFLPSRDTRSWLLRREDSSVGTVSVLSRSGEKLEWLHLAFSCAGNERERALSTLEQILESHHFQERNLKGERTLMSGIHFGQTTIVHGNVINVEGDQSFHYSTDAIPLVNKIQELLKIVVDGHQNEVKELAHYLNGLAIQAGEEYVRQAIQESVSSFCEKHPQSKTKLSQWAQSFVTSTTGSGLVALIQEAIRVFC